ncbi:MAG: PqqD family peptide modification chaperone [bacterium]
MNFVEKRKLLKESNFLELTPVKVMAHEIREEGLVNILMPRFKNIYLSRMFQPRRKEKVIKIKLDASGSKVWLKIDGITKVSEICEHLAAENPSLFTSVPETETRVTRFLSMLYLQRYITFREIQ